MQQPNSKCVMNDQEKSREQLIEELAHFRQWNAELDAQLSLSQQAEADQRQINNNLPMLVGIAGLDGYQREVNAAFERILGWSELESRSRPFLEFVHPNDRAASVEAIAQLKAGTSVVNFINRNICRDGSYRWINWTVVPVPDRDIVFGIGQDITEQKRAEEAVSQSEQRMRLHVQQTLLAVIEWDREFRVIAWNPGAERIFGYAEQEALGQHYSFIVPDTVQEQVKPVWAVLLTKRGGERCTNKNVTKDGRIISCEWYNTPLVNADGLVIGFASLAEDITDRVRMEAAVRASETKYRRLHQSMRDAFVSVDMSGHIQEFNDAYRQMLGYEPEELLARTYVDLTPEKWHSFEAQIVQEQILHLGYSRTYEKEYRRKDGTVFPVELRTFLLTDDEGNPTAMWAIIRDITERKASEAALRRSHDELDQKVRERTAELLTANASLRSEIQERLRAEHELSQSEAKYKALVESSPDAILMCDLEGRIMFASHRAAEQHGCDDARELVGRPAADLVVPGDRDRLKENIRRVVRDGLRRNDLYQGLRRDGTTFFGEASAAVIYGVSGEPEAFTAVYQDITERKRAQDALKKERDALRRMLQASDHDREMITFEIHDGVAQRLLGALMQFEAYDQQATHESEKLKAIFEGGLQALREASAEARSLMNRTRTPVLEKFGVKAALADFIDHISERPNAPEVTYRCEVEFHRLAPIIENAIFRVAQEALTNACLHSKSELIRVTLVQDGEEVTLGVQDYGIGFDPATVASGRFGLDGMRERSRSFGKELQLESTPGQGTRIRATFPVITPDD